MWQTLSATPFSWPEWWPELQNVHNVKLVDGITGSAFSCTWKARGYTLRSDITVRESHFPDSIIMCSTGDLVGTANCNIKEIKGSTIIKMDWQVQTTKAWMNLLAPVLKPLFTSNHHRVMNSGERGIQRYMASKAENPA